MYVDVAWSSYAGDSGFGADHDRQAPGSVCRGASDFTFVSIEVGRESDGWVEVRQG